jgi:dihydroflavonol-4-reductase
MPKLVVLTGITGFIAKRIALDLLEAGYAVRGSLRSAGRADEVRNALRPRLSDPAALDQLSFVELDLGRDDGWAEAMEGADALFHTASPFPMAQPKDENEIIKPAVDGTLRALRAAQSAGVTRVVLTSSVVAIEAKAKIRCLYRRRLVRYGASEIERLLQVQDAGRTGGLGFRGGAS